MTGGAFRVALSGTLLLAAAASWAASPPAARPTVLLITLDTTRADHLGCYGAQGVKTPVLDRLAAGGVVLEQARAHVPLTLPSHATLMTGRLPSTLNLRVNGLVLRQGPWTLAERLRAEGYRTAAVVASVILAKSRGLARGFDAYDDKMTLQPRGGGAPEERRAEEVTDAALQLAQAGPGPLFLWVHYYDPHYEYRPPEPYASRFAKNPYDGEVAYMDAQIGRLLEGLEKLGLMRDALVVAAGDHGEGLMEHGERQHGIFLYEYAVHVPVFVRWKGHLPEGRRAGGLCALSDLAPTILDLLGLKPGPCDGRSLRPMLEGGTMAPEAVYLETYHGFFSYGWAPLRGLVDGGWKYIEAPRPELYRYRESEEANLMESERARSEAMKRALAKFPAADTQERAQMERLLKDPSNAENLKQLLSLGYLSGGGQRPDAAGLLDPKDGLGLENELLQAQEEMYTDPEKAAARLLAVLKRNPQNVPALSVLGGIYLRGGTLDRARACFAEQVRLKPQMDSGHLNLGTVLKRQGDAAGAEREYRAALAVNPGMAEGVASLSQLLITQRRLDEAQKVLDAGLKEGAESADLYFELGVLQASKKEFDGARFSFTKSLALDPTRHQAAANLGRIAFQAGRVDEAIACYQRALRTAPNNPEYLATLGSLYLNGKDDPAAALGWFRRALAADPYGPGAENLREIIAGLEASADRRAPPR